MIFKINDNLFVKAKNIEEARKLLKQSNIIYNSIYKFYYKYTVKEIEFNNYENKESFLDLLERYMIYKQEMEMFGKASITIYEQSNLIELKAKLIIMKFKDYVKLHNMNITLISKQNIKEYNGGQLVKVYNWNLNTDYCNFINNKVSIKYNNGI
jgi:hypothetical protein